MYVSKFIEIIKNSNEDASLNKIAFGSWAPVSAEKGLWFYTAAASILPSSSSKAIK